MGWRLQGGLALALALVALPGTTAASDCVSAPSGMVGWWPGEGTADDAFGHNLETSDSSVGYSTGEVGQAFNFSGNSEVHILAAADLDVGPYPGFTIEAWINPANVTQAQCLLEWSDSMVPFHGVALSIAAPMSINRTNSGGSGCLLVDIVDTSEMDHVVSTPAGLLVSNVWEHVAVTFNRFDGTATLFVNGSMVTQTNLGTIVPQTQYDLWFAINASGAGGACPYIGAMDEVSLYNRELSPAEIGSIYLAGSNGKCPLRPTGVYLLYNQIVPTGFNMSILAFANGTPPLSFQWSFNGTNLPGETNSSLTIDNIQPTNSGSYSLQVSNFLGSATSGNAEVTVNPQALPVITAQPTNQTVQVSNTASFQVTAVGGPPLSYQWYFNVNTAPISGATNPVLTLTNVQVGQSGFYYVQVGAAGSSIQSSDTVLAVPQPPNWMLSFAPRPTWNSMASSADGCKLAAAMRYPVGGIYTSTNSGMTWALTSAPTNYWSQIVSSADGDTLFASSANGFYASTNSGGTWIHFNSPNGVLACSADAMKVAMAVYNDGIYTSINSGSTWTKTSAPKIYWYAIASSADGTKFVAEANNGGGIYTSTNAGATWNQTSAPTSTGYGVAIACSSNGTKLVAAYYDGPIYISTDSGASWVHTSAPFGNWLYIASSADGTKLAAIIQDSIDITGTIYTSTNAGVTWTSASAPVVTWTCLSSSADGRRLAAGTDHSGIYIWQAVPTLGEAFSSNSLSLSWPLFWMGSGLQQNFDLATTNWADLAITPIMTNGECQVILPNSGGSSFYRLKYP